MKNAVFDDTGLKAYEAKRNFRQTKEPKPRFARSPAKKALMFVIQKHDATRLHYDFRLEIEGVLKSWAVPKGIPMARGEKRLAIHVEDHPMDYASFEGTIPEGNYGGGTVMVWDTGTYEVSSTDPLAALKEGKLHLQMAGKKLKGEWALVRIKPRPGEKESWLLFKGGEDANPLSAKKDDESVLTGRSMGKIASDNDAQWASNRKDSSAKKSPPINKTPPAKYSYKKKGADSAKSTSKNSSHKTLGKLPVSKLDFISPMKCRLVKTPPRGKKWIYEIKFDGFRALVIKHGENVQLLSRSAKDLTARFPEISEAMHALPFRDGILDGEIVALDKQGRSSFQLLQMANTPGEKRAAICFYAFDVLNLEGKNLTGYFLHQRKAILRALIASTHEPIRFSAAIHGDPDKLLAEIRKRGLEGIIAKRLDSKYEAGLRTGLWVKVKVVNEQEFVIGGYTAPKGSRDFFGALLIGYFERGKFIFATKVGTGFNQALLTSLHNEFKKIQNADCPFTNLPEKRSSRYGGGVTAAEMEHCTWVKPKLVCQIKFTEWTRDGHLRHPVFLGLREDKEAREVVRET
ncbi:MAG: non-homologous end-joining DNA ligase [Verrucomicrobiota bacterium]